MNIYFDLTMLSNLLLSMVSLFFVRIIATYRAKKGALIVLILGHTLSIYIHYLNEYIGYFVLILFLLLMMRLCYKKKWFKATILYLFCYYGLGLFLFIIDPNICLYRFIITINEPSAMIKLILVPIFALSLVLSMSFVDRLYCLKNYKTECVITYKEHHLVLSSYYDTGNTLRYLNIPVIFVVKDRWPYLSKCETEKIPLQTISSSEEKEGFKALIDLGEQDESFFVYVVLTDNVDSFNGCDCLLNAFLI